MDAQTIAQLRADVLGRPLATSRAFADTLRSLIAGPIVGSGMATPAQAAGSSQRTARATSADAGGIGVIPIFGPVTYRNTFLTWLFEGTALQDVQAQLRALLASPSTTGIVLLFDSPGGVADGVSEVANEIAQAAQQLPIVAMVEMMACSAAYWLASACSTIIASPTADVGSVGVYALHLDESGANAQAGVVPTYVYAGANKVEGNPDAPLSSAARQHMQSQVDQLYSMFVGDVARGRSLSPSAVEGRFGQGRSYLASQAVARGMVDQIGTFGTALRTAQQRRIDRQRRADVEWAEIEMSFRQRQAGVPAPPRSDVDVDLAEAEIEIRRRR